ncbi:sugar phosphate isomerase/epimerase family protein [Herbidospora cretacea]|uniref:sugar phosphate isomerase/epimerase family protein n=1 Tax=Herbidospora cretacea TaxID=28444 RepID=UPI000773DB92|nr:sugar phosphate isomerase/epimerase family protein [Herbidospora cretacea]
MNFGYCSNGFRDHSLDDALTVLADLGYTGVALTLDHGHLGPDPAFDEVSRVATRLGRLGLSVVVETGGRYTLDPFRKHFPTLLHDDAGARVSYTKRAIEVAADLGAPVVHLWSGIRPAEVSDALAWDRLTAHCETLLAHAEEHDVVLGFEPEPGMLVDDLASYERLRKRLGEPGRFGLTLDIGHCRCLEPWPVAECVRRASPYLVHVQIDDMRRGVHEHLEFGDGEIEFAPVLAELREFGGMIAVELARHSHAAPAVAQRSIDFLRGLR